MPVPRERLWTKGHGSFIRIRAGTRQGEQIR
jgi:hypothetical protein